MISQTTLAPAPRMAFANNKAAATALAEHAAATDPEQPLYDAFPYSRFDENFTPWWLVRAHHQRPAYAYSKLEVLQLKDGPAAGFASVAFRVEKGFAPDLPRELRKPAEKQLGHTWAWHGIVRSVGAGELDAAVQQVLERTGLPLFVEVSLSPERDSEDSGHGHEERVVLVAEADPLRLRLESRGNDLLEALNGATTLREVGEHLATPNWQPHFWGSLRLGVRLDYAAAGHPAWDAVQLWDRACSPWEPWVL